MYIFADNKLRRVEAGFPVDDLDIDRLLANWRWLCSQKMRLIGRNAFGDLFLCDEVGHVHWLDVGVGNLEKLTDSEAQFQACLKEKEFRERWLAEDDEESNAKRGLIPNAEQCIAFEIPIVFKEGRDTEPYIIDLYECVSFLGDLHQQLRGLPDGAEVRLIIGPKPK